jgi:hypothetical protein
LLKDHVKNFFESLLFWYKEKATEVSDLYILNTFDH